MSQPESEAENFLAKHPRMIGVLFMMLVLLSKMGMAAGSSGAVTYGP